MSAAVAKTLAETRLDPWKTWPVTIQRVKLESPGVFTADLDFDRAEACERFQYSPGQFNMLYVPGVGEAAISIAGKTTAGRLQHTIRSVGSVTQAMEAGGVGMSLGLRGPFGRPWPIKLMEESTEKTDLIIAAGGIGIAPLRSLVHHIAKHRDRFGVVSVLIGARAPDDLLYVEEFDDWSSKGIHVQITVDRGPANWNGHIGVVTLLIDRLAIHRPAATMVMTCGPEVMMRYVAKSATGRGIPEQNVWVTLERNMNCAIGLCGHCQLGPKFVCKEGPVFRFDEVSSWLRVQEL